MSQQTPEKTKRKKVDTPRYRGVEGCDEVVTVVCSRYEREREPLSLIRTCQELAFRNPTVARISVFRSRRRAIGSGRFAKELERSRSKFVLVIVLVALGEQEFGLWMEEESKRQEVGRKGVKYICGRWEIHSLARVGLCFAGEDGLAGANRGRVLL